MVTRKKASAVIAGVLLAAVTVFLVAYFSGLPPFEKRGEIKADEVCGSLADGEAATAALSKVLPDKGEYRFDGQDGLRSDQSESSFESNCFVWSDGKTVFGISTELVRSSSPKLWQEQVLRDEREEVVNGGGKPVAFEAGENAFASSRMAAVYVPCVSDGKVPGGPRNLSVVARAVQEPAASATDARQGLAKLALLMGERAHQQAKCDVPSKLPDDTPSM